MILPPRNNSSLPNVDSSSSPLSHSIASLKQVAAPSSLSDLAGPTSISPSILHTANIGAHDDDLIGHEPVLHARSDSLSFQQQSFSSHHCQFHSEPVVQTVVARAEPSQYSFSNATNTQSQRRRRSLQRSVTPVLPFPNSGTVSADRGCRTADTVNSPSWVYCRAEPLQRVSDAVLTRGAWSSL